MANRHGCLPAMLVNELQKQSSRIEQRQREIAELLARLAALESGKGTPPIGDLWPRITVAGTWYFFET